jgi:hypothetical protein
MFVRTKGLMLASMIAGNVYAWWHIYIDGLLQGKTIGYWPENVVTNNNYIGLSNWAADAPYFGYMDSFLILQTAVGWQEAWSLYTV